MADNMVEEMLRGLDELFAGHENLQAARSLVATKAAIHIERERQRITSGMSDRYNDAYTKHVANYNKIVEERVYNRFKEEYFEDYHKKIVKALEDIAPDVCFYYDPCEDEY